MDWRIHLAIETMRRDFAQPVAIAALAELVGLSPSRFSHLFRLETGTSPKRYLRRLRLDRARQLTVDSLLSVKEIMAAVGFNDPSHFVRDFERHHGVSPRRMRARARSPGRPARATRSSSRFGQRTGGSANARLRSGGRPLLCSEGARAQGARVC